MPSLTKIQSGFMEAQDALPLNPGTAAAPSLKFSDHAGTGMFSPSTGALGFSSGGSSQALTITSSGNVGINHTNPTAKLSVTGNIYVSSDSFTNVNGGIFFSGWNDYSAGVYSRNSGDDLVLQSNGNERLRLTSTGKITQTNFSGIGFHMSGSGDPTLQISDTDGTNQHVMLAHNGGDSYIVTRNNTSHGSFRVYSQDGSSTLTRLRIDANGRILVGPGANATPKCGYAGIDVPNNDWAIIMGGSDGYGNRANNANKDGRFAGAHYVNAEEPIGIIRCTSGATASELHMGGGTSLVNAATQLSFYTAANTTTTGGTERLRIGSGGEIRIMTANGQIKWLASSGNDPFIRSIGSGQQELEFNTGGDERLRITSGGFIGAGTASPRRHFHIHETASATVGFQMTNAGTGAENDSQGFQLKVGSDGHAEIAQMENSNLRFFTNASERMRIASDGKIAIGGNYTQTSTFGRKVLISGTVGLNNDSGNVGIGFHRSTSNTYGYIGTGAWAVSGLSNDDFGISSGATGDLVFGTGASGYSAKMTIANNGNVGIGNARSAYPIDLQSTTSPLTLNLKLNKSSTTGDYAEIAFQLWNGAGTGANTFGGSGTSRPSVVLRAVNEYTNTAAGAFVVATWPGGTDNSGLEERFRIKSNGTIQFTPEGATTDPNASFDTSGDNFRINTKKDGSGGTGFIVQTQNGGVLYERLRIADNGQFRIQTERATKYASSSTAVGLYKYRLAVSMVGNVAYTIRLRGFSNGAHHVRLMGSHWTGGYQLVKESYYYTDVYAGISELSVHTQTSTAQGAWGVSRPASGQTGYQSDLIITKSAGTYAGGHRGLIEITTPSDLYLVSIT